MSRFVKSLFGGSSKSELADLTKALRDTSIAKKKDGMRNVIKRMTAGKDASALLPDVVNCMSFPDLELKKLVYLYFLSYVKTQPKLAILAVNSFRQDCDDPNPLIRALAVRTMGCINVKDEEEQVTEYLIEPLQKACRDPDAYVRKTAAICIAKLYDMDPEDMEEKGFIDILRDMHGDANSMVVANSVVALLDMSAHNDGKLLYDFAPGEKDKLLAALNECGSEWGQVAILDALSKYKPKGPQDVESLLERVKGCFAHSNAAVVLSAVKVTMTFLELVENDEFVDRLAYRLARPLIALSLSEESEVQYVVLKSITIIIKKYPAILQDQVKMFFCKYYDPLHVKLEKLGILVPLATEDSLETVLSEVKDYCQEVDVEFVRRSVQALGKLAIKMPGRKADRCVDVLMELINTGEQTIVMEGVTVMKDVFRRYPGRYERIIGDLCEKIDALEEPETKASMVWIIGEYADRIDESREMLESFLENFKDETAEVQLALITAVVKCYLLVGGEDEEALIKEVLELATQMHNPDVRDRAFMYWRLLDADPEVAKEIIITDRPAINDGTKPTGLMEMLLDQIGTLSSVYNLPPLAVDIQAPAEVYEDEEEDMGDVISRLKDTMRTGQVDDDDEDDEEDDLGSGSESGEEEEEDVQPLPVAPQQVLAANTQSQDRGQGGLEINAKIVRLRGKIGVQMQIRNHSGAPVQNFAVQIQKNAFGLGPAANLQVPPIGPQSQQETTLELRPQMQEMLSGKPPDQQLGLQIALKCEPLGVFYFNIMFDLFVCLTEAPAISSQQLQQVWGNKEMQLLQVPCMSQMQLRPPMVISRLRQGNLRHVMNRSDGGVEKLYFSCMATNRIASAIEIGIIDGKPQVQLSVKSSQAPMNAPIIAFLLKLLNLRPS
jgi:AP-1 complex subunit beta-1